MLFTVMTLVGCLIGYWLLMPARVQPLSWLDEWQDEVLQPLAKAQLTLGQLAPRLPAAELWLQPGSDGPGPLRLGALLFMLADSLIGLNKFVQPFPHAVLVIVCCYFSGQALIAWGLLRLRAAAATAATSPAPVATAG